MKKAKILISAYACEPNKGSEPGVGWNWVQHIARFHEVWIITRANNRVAIQSCSQQENQKHIHWVFYDLPRWAKFWKKGGRGVRLYYYLWQLRIYFLAKKLHKKIEFDIVHHLTFGISWLPSFLVFLKVPFVWGPVGGAEKTPKAVFSTYSWRGRIFEYSRNLTQWFALRDPFMQSTIKRTTISLTKAPETADFLRKLGAKKVIVFSEAAIANKEISTLAKLPVKYEEPLRFLSIGRLIHWKGFHLGLQAFHILQQKNPNSEFWFIGDGPEKDNLQKLARSLNLDNKVCFLGNLPRSKVLEKISNCDVLVHPSLHDSGGWVCLEAMAAGRPVICLDIGGPATQVTEETGFKIPVNHYEQVLNDVAAAMLQFAVNPALKEKMGQAAKRRVKDHFNWDRKGELINDIYLKLLTQQ